MTASVAPGFPKTEVESTDFIWTFSSLKSLTFIIFGYYKKREKRFLEPKFVFTNRDLHDCKSHPDIGGRILVVTDATAWKQNNICTLRFIDTGLPTWAHPVNACLILAG